MRILNEGTEIRLLQFADDIALAASSEDGRMVWTHLSFHVAMLVPRDSGVLHSRSFGPQVFGQIPIHFLQRKSDRGNDFSCTCTCEKKNGRHW